MWLLIKYCRAWTLPALKYWKATTEKIPAKESKKILTIILQVPACLLISKFWLDDIVGELTLDGKMQRSVSCRPIFQHRTKERENFIRLKKINSPGLFWGMAIGYGLHCLALIICLTLLIRWKSSSSLFPCRHFFMMKMYNYLNSNGY